MILSFFLSKVIKKGSSVYSAYEQLLKEEKVLFEG